jgi:hypothetical protein
MMKIEKEFGAIPLGYVTTTPKINVNLNIFGEPEQSLKTSLWELLAKKLDAPPAKFKAFITLIEQASLMNA